MLWSWSRPSSDNEPHGDVRWLPCAVSSPFTKKVSARRDSPALGFTRRFASVGVAVQGMDGMEVCGRADETQDGAPVAS
jgi:hypothetical protein